jgi:hypothetical protein
MFLANFTDLTTLNLSFNKLEGKIPVGGVFSNMSSQSLIGNAGLCGAPCLGFSPCHEKSHSQKRQFLKFFLPVAIIAFVSIVVSVYITTRRKLKNNRDVKDLFNDQDNVTSQRLVSSHELIIATDNFSDDNLLGTGSFGKVYKGQLSTGMVVAIKVLDLQQDEATRSFDAECHVLRQAPHRNLIKDTKCLFEPCL